MMDVRHAADAAVYMAGPPRCANVLSMSVMATKMPYVGRGDPRRAAVSDMICSDLG